MVLITQSICGFVGGTPRAETSLSAPPWRVQIGRAHMIGWMIRSLFQVIVHNKDTEVADGAEFRSSSARRLRDFPSYGSSL